MFGKIALMGAASLLALTGFATGTIGAADPGAVEGRIYHYVRSNRDGTSPEHVYVYRAASNRLEIYKMTEQCTNAAFVTAWVNADNGRAVVITGGRLMPQARYENFARITFDGASRMLDAEAALPDGMVGGRQRVDEQVWHLFDTDLATLSLQTMAASDPRADFSFGLPLVWTEPEDGQFVRNLGRADAVYAGEEEYQGRPAFRFDVGGPAFGDNGGPLWIDAEDGHVLGVQWGIPNHAGMDDFALRLTEVTDGGETGWQALLTDHFEGCTTA
jgi:hypothetical protein